jgi:hypothetical protein
MMFGSKNFSRKGAKAQRREEDALEAKPLSIAIFPQIARPDLCRMPAALHHFFAPFAPLRETISPLPPSQG